MIRLRELATLSAACKAAYDSALSDNDHAAARVLEEIGGAIAKLIGECVVGEKRDSATAKATS